MRFVIAQLAALVLVVSSGLVPGLWNGRWKVSHAIETAVARLDRIPETVGAWEARSIVADSKMLAQAEVDGHLSRVYHNRRTGDEVSVFLVCGRPGPVSLHTPDVCYPGAGYNPASEPAAEQLQADPAAAPAAFWKGEFRKSSAGVPDTLLIYWSWNATGAWEAPVRPRLRFTPAFPALYKLYIVRRMTSSDAEAEEKILQEFLRQWLPEVDQTLFPGGSR
jgi:hypothetical protein